MPLPSAVDGEPHIPLVTIRRVAAAQWGMTSLKSASGPREHALRLGSS